MALGPESTQNDRGEFTEAQLTSNFVCTISPISSSYTVLNIGGYYSVSHMCCTRGDRKPRKKIPSRAKAYRRLWMQKAMRRSMQMQCDITIVKNTCVNGHVRRLGAAARIGRTGTRSSRRQVGRFSRYWCVSRCAGCGAFVELVRCIGLDTPRSLSTRCRSVALKLETLGRARP